jgi:hypothetical protein
MWHVVCVCTFGRGKRTWLWAPNYHVQLRIQTRRQPPLHKLCVVNLSDEGSAIQLPGTEPLPVGGGGDREGRRLRGFDGLTGESRGRVKSHR